jgi:hypothetical protein
MTIPTAPDNGFDICLEDWIKECLSYKNNTYV